MATASARKKPDFLHPIQHPGRKEYLAVTYDQVIRSENEAILNYLLQDGFQEYHTVYPKLDILKSATRDQIFQIAISFTDRQLLTFLRDTNKYPEEDQENVNRIRKVYSTGNSSVLRMDIALSHLMTLDTVQAVYVVDPYMDDAKMRVLYEFFTTQCNRKLMAVRGDITEFISQRNKEITTAYLVDVEDIYTLTKNHRDVVKDMYFLCSGSLLSNYDLIYQDGVKPPVYKYHAWFQKCIEDKLCIVDYFLPIIYDFK